MYTCVYTCVYVHIYDIHRCIYIYMYVRVYTYVYTWHPHSGGTQMFVITTYSQAGFDDLLRKCMCYILYRVYSIVFRDYPGPQSLTFLLSLRIMTRVQMSQRIKRREEWPELFFTAGLRDPASRVVVRGSSSSCVVPTASSAFIWCSLCCCCHHSYW